MADLRSRALFGIDTSLGRGLEIGPLNRPLLLRASNRVFYADHCSTEELREKYRGNTDVPSDTICAVDFDLSQTKLSEVGREGKFDYVVASHVIEHVPDIVGWLRDIYGILNDGGILALVVPDKRFTFDVFRRPTTFWMVKEAVGRSRPSIEIVIDHFMNIVHADAGKLWDGHDNCHDFRRVTSPRVCPDLITRYDRGEYIDAHCWVVTPASFLTLLGKITNHYNVNFELCFFEATPRRQLEFYVQLRKSAAKTDWDAWAKQADQIEC